MSDQWAVPTKKQRAAWDDFRRRCLARNLHDPGPCPEKWPAEAGAAGRIVEILRSACDDEASLKALFEAMGRDRAE